MRITIDIEPSPKSSVPDMLLGALPFLAQHIAPLLLRWLKPEPLPSLDGIDADYSKAWEQVIEQMRNAYPAPENRAPRVPTQRRMPLGFSSVTPIAPGETRDVIARPQLPWRGRSLVIPRTIASSFSVEDIRVGSASQFAAVGGMPGEVFAASEDEDAAPPPEMFFDAAPCAADVCIRVRNTGDMPLMFAATMMGDVFDR